MRRSLEDTMNSSAASTTGVARSPNRVRATTANATSRNDTKVPAVYESQQNNEIPGLRAAGRAICVRTPFRKIAVRHSLRDRRLRAPQSGGRNHETRTEDTKFAWVRRAVLRCPCFSRRETNSADATKRLLVPQVARTTSRQCRREAIAVPNRQQIACWTNRPRRVHDSAWSAGGP